jgi:hypothetical protein
MSLKRIPASKEEALNTLIQSEGIDTNKISDGFHTFEDLYKHRTMLFMCLCKMAVDSSIGFYCWKSIKHYDDSEYNGWFIMGLKSVTDSTLNISYHLPMSCWNDCGFAITAVRALKWDGHTSDDVLVRLSKMFL